MTFPRSLLFLSFLLLAAVLPTVTAFTSSALSQPALACSRSRSSSGTYCAPAPPLHAALVSSLEQSCGSSTRNNSNNNLYSILGATGTETRDELKHLYRQAAKRLHPDAMSRSTTSPADDFSQLAHAYKLLSDPKRRLSYDRRLLADQFTQQACDCIEQVADVAAKSVVNALDWMQQAMDSVQHQQQQQQQQHRHSGRRQHQWLAQHNPFQKLSPPTWRVQLQPQRRSSWTTMSSSPVDTQTKDSSMDWQRIMHNQLATAATVALVVGVHLLCWNDAAAGAHAA